MNTIKKPARAKRRQGTGAWGSTAPHGHNGYAVIQARRVIGEFNAYEDAKTAALSAGGHVVRCNDVSKFGYIWPAENGPCRKCGAPHVRRVLKSEVYLCNPCFVIKGKAEV